MTKHPVETLFPDNPTPPTRRRQAFLFSLVTTALLLLGLLAATSGLVRAEEPAFGVRQVFDAGTVHIADFATGDMDGDGALDIVVVRQSGSAHSIFLNDGSGSVYGDSNVRSFGADQFRTRTVAVGDVNNDGRLDILTGGRADQKTPVTLVYLNSESGISPDGQAIAPEEFIRVGDVNGDGFLDIVGRQAVYLNDGNTVFTEQPFAATLKSAALVDMDGNGTLDLLGTAGSETRVYANDGAGNFQAGPPLQTQTDGLRSRMLAVGDMDRDGAPDVILASWQRVYTPRYRIELELAFCRNTLRDDGSIPCYTFESSDFQPANLSLGDVDGNGYLDVVTSSLSRPSVVYFNYGRAVDPSDPAGYVLAFQRGTPYSSSSLKTLPADVDGDGDLDLISSSYTGGTIFFNDGSGSLAVSASSTGVLNTGVAPSGNAQEFTQTVPLSSTTLVLNEDDDISSLARAATELTAPPIAVADLDADGRLDVVAGNAVYLQNTAGGLSDKIELAGMPEASSLVIANIDSANGPDLIYVSNGRSNGIYFNDGEGNFPESAKRSFGSGADRSLSLAISDLDGDGTLDMVVGNEGANQLYFNDGTGRFHQEAVVEFGSSRDSTHSVAVGDLNGDGAPDIVTGNSKKGNAQRNLIYINDGAAHFGVPNGTRSFGVVLQHTRGLALADMDGDGDLDIVTGNSHGPTGGDRQNYVYVNDGRANFNEHAFGPGVDATRTLVTADMDGDGDLDILVGNGRMWSTDSAERGKFGSKIYLNNGIGSFSVSRSVGDDLDEVQQVAVGDMDGDGDMDVIRSYVREDKVLLEIVPNELQQSPGLINGPPTVSIAGPEALIQGGVASQIFTTSTIPISYTLRDPENDRVAFIRACYSLNGGDNWQVAVPAGDPAPEPASVSRPANGCPYVSATPVLTHGLEATRDGSSFVFLWDTIASGFFGRSDQVVFRIEAFPGHGATANGIPDSFQRAYVSTTSNTFRVRGTQVRVYKEAIDPANLASGALVYRLPAGQVSGATLLGDTGPNGFMRGRGRIERDDSLVAMLPISATDTYSFYITSAQPISSGIGLELADMGASGIRNLVVKQSNPLLLFSLDISLEWDARNDGSFLADLQGAILRASEVFYDVTNGQMALGEVRIHQNKENWLDSDVVIYADNSIRPRATMGGVVRSQVTDVVSSTRIITDAYSPGQIFMGPLWDPFGESRAELTQDWWRALAHELGHYLLYLPDNYLGYAPDGTITSVDCQGSFMTTAYDDKYSEFLTSNQWTGECTQTLAARLTGRPDWDTISKFYPEIVANQGEIPGPATLPFDVTQVTIVPPAAKATALRARNFDLRDESTRKRLIVSQGKAYLRKTLGTSDLEDDRVIALGVTGKSDFIKVRGADVGDELCVFDYSDTPAHLGCTNIDQFTTDISLNLVPDWRPNVKVEPIFAPEMVISVTFPLTSEQPVARVLPLLGHTPVLTVTQPVTPGESYELEISQPARTFTFTKPAAEGEPYTLVLMRPALAVTVTLQQPLNEALNVQVLPSYGSSDPRIPTRSPAFSLAAVDSTAPITFARLIPLDYPLLAGFVRIWVSDTAKTAYSQFFAPPVWPADFRPGAGADFRPGAGADFRPGAGADFRPGAGADFRPGAGADFRPGAGADFRPGSGADYRPGAGADFRPGAGADFRPGAGADFRPGAGADFRPGAGADFRPGAGVNLRAGGNANLRVLGVNRRAMGAPVASSDGQVTIFNREDIFADTGTATLESLPVAPQLPRWLTPVGQTYRFVERGAVERTIAFNYLQRDVPDGYEYTLKIYYSGDEGRSWQALNTRLDMKENLTTAPAIASGIYALVAVLDIPLPTTGWNLFAYPVPESRPVTVALESLGDAYTTIIGFDRTDEGDPWKIYDRGAPLWANDLLTLTFGSGYWIGVTRPVTLHLGVVVNGATPIAVARELAEPLSRRVTPALYYGVIHPRAGVELAPGAPVNAFVGKHVCGTGFVFSDEGGHELRYRVKVAASEVGGLEGCGTPGAQVVFQVGSTFMYGGADDWDNSRPRHLDLTPGS